MDTKALKDRKVLIVDDDDACRIFFEFVVQDLGCGYEVAADGNEAVAKAGAGKFDAIFMDIRMPIMGGYEATRRIRETDKSVPIIAMTAHAFAWEDGECQACGMTDYLIKPFSEEQAIKKLVQWTAGS